MEMPNELQNIALKEWAVSVKALVEGTQIIVMRKGGIVEETRDFQLLSPNFYLMPAYEHQKKHLLKEAYKSELDETLKGWSLDRETVQLDAYASVVMDIEVTDQQTLDRLRNLHIWTDEFAEERLRWKKTKPLHVLVLRVYRLENPAEIANLPAYNGCKSWVRLEEEIKQQAHIPVLNDERFQAEVDKVKQALGS
ncbi:hypothetical protein FHS16_005101 [Paenibacillus endophyticus]|uniref:DUF1802 family protein n=1 Tax=Paenibacillus endophyticus TaxID=1294268 RepID=A0A7W5CCC4_9BACL|nr:DUF1802 family protein [Paenibacillus endophyticus]MBB3155002.1 hypothetical protein [Paenibacillus endophyticus]